MAVTEMIGRYEILKELGRGGMAAVFLCEDPKMHRKVAIKILTRSLALDPVFRERFQREARTLASLEHHAIVPVYDYGEHDKQPFIVMRNMTGGTLEEQVKRGALPVAESIRIISRIASALDELHGHDVVHRDLKPANILFDPRGQAYLSDFGIAKLTFESKELTQDGIIGTPAYMSPEQARGDDLIDKRSDVYSLGVMIFEMLIGQLPFSAATPMQLALMHIIEPLPDIRTIAPGLEPAAVDSLERALKKDPDERYSSAGEFAAALELAFGNHNAVPAPPPATELVDPLVPTDKHKAHKTTTHPKVVAGPPTITEPVVARFTLVAEDSEGKQEEFEINGPRALVGRGRACQVRIQHTEISREHASLTPALEGIYVEDLKSTNGTYVNQTRISGRTLMQGGDILGLGKRIRLTLVDRAKR